MDSSHMFAASRLTITPNLQGRLRIDWLETPRGPKVFIFTFTFFANLVKLFWKAGELLTKRLTIIDKNMKSDKVMSQLSVAILIVLRTHMIAQKSLYI